MRGAEERKESRCMERDDGTQALSEPLRRSTPFALLLAEALAEGEDADVTPGSPQARLHMSTASLPLLAVSTANPASVSRTEAILRLDSTSSTTSTRCRLLAARADQLEARAMVDELEAQSPTPNNNDLELEWEVEVGVGDKETSETGSFAAERESKVRTGLEGDWSALPAECGSKSVLGEESFSVPAPALCPLCAPPDVERADGNRPREIDAVSPLTMQPELGQAGGDSGE